MRFAQAQAKPAKLSQTQPNLTIFKTAPLRSRCKRYIPRVRNALLLLVLVLVRVLVLVLLLLLLLLLIIQQQQLLLLLLLLL